VKAKKFKQFVTEAIKRRSASISVDVEECVFVINDTIYFMTVELDGTVDHEPADSSVGLSASTYVDEWWLNSIPFCEKFTDPKINQQVLAEISNIINDITGLRELDLVADSVEKAVSDYLWKALNEYPMEEVPDAELSQVTSILAKQIDDSSYRNLLYQDLTGNFDERATRELDNEVEHYDNGRW